MRTTFDNKCLASWAVFKRFGESDHKDRYGVLCEFVKATIYKHSLREFTIAVLTEHVNSDYSFNLKPAVIAFAIQRLQIKNDSYGKYTCVPDDFLEQKAILDAIDNEKRESDNVIIQLFKYIESKHQEALIESEKEQIVQSFINYILDNSYSDKYASEISSFVIAYKKGNTISVPLETILEGVVSYAGITFDTPASASSRWTTEMYVYLDTEILFHMAGYNGDLYKTLFDDFYSFVEEINEDSKKNGGGKKIHLRFFCETEEEINNFFDRAKDVVNNKITLMPYVTAMSKITQGCSSDSDIDERRGIFESLLKTHGIIRDPNPEDYYVENHFVLNIENQKLVDDYVKENPKTKAKDVFNSLKSLSHINVLRKGKSNRSFENLKYVLLTDNYITMRLSRSPEIRKPGEKLLSTELYFITNRMWYRLGKAFGNGSTPKVFDVICKAKIILSSQINSSVSAKYDELVRRMDSGEISTESAIEVLYQLRKEVRNPEELDSQEDIEDAWTAITETDISKYAEQRDYLVQQEKKAREENEQLRKENDQILARHEHIKKENVEIREEMAKVKDENRRIEQQNLDLAIQADETSKKINSLELALSESHKRGNALFQLLYKRELDAFIRKKKRQAIINLILFIVFLTSSIVVDWLSKKYKWSFLDGWLKEVCLYILPQLLVVGRSYVTKINPLKTFSILLGKENHNFEQEFKEQSTLAENINT